MTSTISANNLAKTKATGKQESPRLGAVLKIIEKMHNVHFAKIKAKT